ncbi:MAG TPA: sigma-70 family RNA polymerase sigma factor, partial [Solirubrobacteraceae bacterium]|nr:sigma-70 family RNA polymerase sigma factor [Solirubrobacteraceae bacterium]
MRVGPHPTVLADARPALADNRDWTLERDGEIPRRAGAASHARPVRRILLRTASDERLAQLAGAGDRRAFEAITARYGPLLLAHCRGIAKDSGQDAVQQALMSAWRALQRGEHVRDLRAWLFTIAHRAALQMLRDQGRSSESLPDVAGGRSPEEQTEQSTRLRSALAALAGLPPRERDALVWTSIHGRSGRDVARALGVSEDTLRQLTYRARTRARAAMGAFVAPVGRLAAWAGHALRRAGSCAHRAWASAGPLAPAGKLVGLYPLLATAALVGAPVAVLELHGDQSKVVAAAHTGATTTVRSRPLAARTSGHVPGAERASAPGWHGRRRAPATVAYDNGSAHAAAAAPSG